MGKFAGILFAVFLLIPVFSLAQTAPPPGNVYDTAPFNANPKLAMSLNCSPAFSCSQMTNDTAMVALANKCAKQTMGFPDGIMNKMMSRGPYKNCVIPSTYAKQGAGLGAKAQWPVCCIKENSGNACEMVCHFYMTNEAQ